MKRLFVLFWRVSRKDLRFLWFALRHPSLAIDPVR